LAKKTQLQELIEEKEAEAQKLRNQLEYLDSFIKQLIAKRDAKKGVPSVIKHASEKE
jgi:hypothetical protein